MGSIRPAHGRRIPCRSEVVNTLGVRQYVRQFPRGNLRALSHQRQPQKEHFRPPAPEIFAPLPGGPVANETHSPVRLVRIPLAGGVVRWCAGGVVRYITPPVFPPTQLRIVRRSGSVAGLQDRNETHSQAGGMQSPCQSGPLPIAECTYTKVVDGRRAESDDTSTVGEWP